MFGLRQGPSQIAIFDEWPSFLDGGWDEHTFER
jgi:hypothetical protein